VTKFVALVDGIDGARGVRIPDFPGCYGAGETIEAAVDDATRALRAFAADMVADDEKIPAPRDLDVIRAEQKARGEPDDIAVYVPLLIDKQRSVRANISLDAGLLEQIDVAAKQRGLTRSSFIASAAIDKIARAI
jgi:predicted RNase H-like HicB family nuclease